MVCDKSPAQEFCDWMNYWYGIFAWNQEKSYIYEYYHNYKLLVKD